MAGDCGWRSNCHDLGNWLPMNAVNTGHNHKRLGVSLG